MAKLYTRTTVLIGTYHFANDCPTERRVFLSMAAYDVLAKEHGWGSFGTNQLSWCTKPVEISALVESKKLRWAEKNGGTLSIEDVAVLGEDLWHFEGPHF